ncbi:MAG: dimethylsulfonioproprionate lyase family protein [Roseovarius sp.]
MQDPFQQFLSEMAETFRAEDRTCADQTAEALLTATEVMPLVNAAPEYGAAIRDLLAGSPLSVARAALAAHDLLPWGQNPVASRVAPKDGAVFSVVNLLGPDAPLYCPSLRAGLYYQRPNTRYGLHSHAAVETYVIIAGRALWTAGDAQRELAAGHSVHHSTYLPHACQTGEEGVVALWRWSGDIGIESYRVHHGTEAFGAFAA